MALREKILDASKDLLIEQGFSNLSMRKIAGRAGITATSIYLYFKNKDDLLLTIIEESIEHLKQILARRQDVTKSVPEQIGDMARAYIRYALEHPKEYEIIFMVRPEEMPTYPREKFRQARSGYEFIARIIKQGKEKGQIETDDPLMTAYILWAQIHGVVSVILSKRLDNRIPQKEFVDQAIDHIIQGFIIQRTPA